RAAVSPVGPPRGAPDRPVAAAHDAARRRNRNRRPSRRRRQRVRPGDLPWRPAPRSSCAGLRAVRYDRGDRGRWDAVARAGPRAAVARDPSTEPDGRRCTPAQLSTFDEARRRTLAVAVRPVEPARVDPRTTRVTFTVVATHAALVDVKLSAVGAGTPLVLLQGTLEGVREIAWDGLLGNRRLAPPGRYTLAVAGRSRVTGAS